MSHVLGTVGACAYVCLVRTFMLAPAAVFPFHYIKLPGGSPSSGSPCSEAFAVRTRRREARSSWRAAPA